MRAVIIGNAGGGKSTLARKIASKLQIPHVEIDKLLWQEGWIETPREIYERRHNDLISEKDWIIDGLGRRDSIPARLDRATKIVLIDMPLWMHFWLAAERQIKWATVGLEHRPGGITDMPPTKGLFQAIWDVEQNWMPEIRALCTAAEQQEKTVIRLESVADIDAFAA